LVKTLTHPDHFYGTHNGRRVNDEYWDMWSHWEGDCLVDWDCDNSRFFVTDAGWQALEEWRSQNEADEDTEEMADQTGD
jgi:hypothetical protein